MSSRHNTGGTDHSGLHAESIHFRHAGLANMTGLSSLGAWPRDTYELVSHGELLVHGNEALHRDFENHLCEHVCE